MVEFQDWLLPIPRARYAKTQVAMLEQLVQADPLAAAVPDEEAATFFAVAFSLRFSELHLLGSLTKALSLGRPVRGEQHRRAAVRAALRCWRLPAHRKVLLLAPQVISFGEIPDVVSGREVTWDLLLRAGRERQAAIGWITYVMKLRGWEEQIPRFIDELGEWARLEDRLCLLAGKLLVRQFGCAPEARRDRRRSPDPTRQAEREARLLSELARDYQQMAHLRTEADRQSRRTAREITALLERANAEVAAAEAALQRRLAAHRQELGEQAKEHQRQVDKLRAELAKIRQAFATAIAQRTAQVGIQPLKGWTLSVHGDGENLNGYSMLVESAGGLLVESGGDLRIELGTTGPSEPGLGLFRTPEVGLAALERMLGRQVLPALPRLAGRRTAAAGSGGDSP